MTKFRKALLAVILGTMTMSGCEFTNFSDVVKPSTGVSSSTSENTSSSTTSVELTGDALILDELVARVTIPQAGQEVINNFQLPATVKYGEYTGTITWTADNGALLIDTKVQTVTDSNTGATREVYNVIVLRPEYSKENDTTANVKLTATVSYASLTGSKNFRVIVPESDPSTEDAWGTVEGLEISSWSEWIAQPTGKIAVKGIITGMVYQAQYSNANVFLQDADGGYYAYAVGEMSEAQANNYLAVGNEVIFEGEKSIYNGLHEFNQEKTTSVQVLSRGNTVAPTDVTEAATKGELTRYQSMWVEATGMFIQEAGKSYFQFGDYKYEMYHSNKYSGSYFDVVEEQLKGIEVGNTVKVRGFVGCYNADQFHPYNIEKVEGVVVTPEQKVAIEAAGVENALNQFNGKKFKETTEISLYASSDDTVSVTYALDANADTSVFALGASSLTVTPTNELKEATLTATISCDDAVVTKTYTFSAQLPQAPVTTVDSYTLTVESLELPKDSYSAGTVAVEGTEFEYIQLGNYGDGIQMRDKDGKTSKLWNTSAFGRGIERIELTYSSTKSTYDNPDAVIFSFGTTNEVSSYTTKLSTTKGTSTYTITPDVNTYTYFYLEHDYGYSMYWAEIKIVLAELQVADQVLTVDSLGLPKDAYSASTATVDGVDYEYIQLGNYGDGIQMRDKDGKTSKLWNTTPFLKGITKIELTYSSTKSTYDNPDAVIFKFGTTDEVSSYETKLSTTKGTSTYTITPDANTYTYFYLEHDYGYSMYWAEIKICFGGTTTPDTPVVPETPVEPDTPVVPETGLMTIPEVQAAADSTKVKVKGIVKSIDTEWSTQHNNMSVTIIDADFNELYIFRLATKVAVGDEVTISGTKTTYYGSVQIDAGATAEIHSSNNPIPAPEVTGETIDVDFSKLGYSNEQEFTSYTSGIVTFSGSNGTNTYGPKYYNSGTAVRFYGSNVFTVDLEDGYVITSIVITYGSSDKTNAITVDTGSFDGKVWSGESNTVNFTIGGTSGHRRIKAVTVAYKAA